MNGVRSTYVIDPVTQQIFNVAETWNSSDPASIHATCEDYRAGATIDCQLDEDDLGHRKIACPMLALWGSGRRGRHPDDVVGEWRKWADDVRGHAIDCGHFLPEEAPARPVQ